MAYDIKLKTVNLVTYYYVTGDTSAKQLLDYCAQQYPRLATGTTAYTTEINQDGSKTICVWSTQVA
jgi:glycine cleavage system aminomethyltransferase T